VAGKKSPASLERKKLREKRERASALAAQSSVKADKKQAWWCQKKRGATYDHLPSSQRKKAKQAEQEIAGSSVRSPGVKSQAIATVISGLVSFGLIIYYYRQLHYWFLAGPDTLYQQYGFSSQIVACLVLILDICLFNTVLDTAFSAIRDWFRSEKDVHSILGELKGYLLFTIAALVLLHSLVLASCLSRTEATPAGVSTYVLGVRTSWHSYEELEEAGHYRTRINTRTGHLIRYAWNYELRFQDGYEIDLEDLDKYCMGRKQYNELYRLVAPYFRD
jgi:hypothetical protein